MRAYFVERFKIINYFTWNMRVEMFLKRSDLFFMAYGLDPNPRNTNHVALCGWSLWDNKTWSYFPTSWRCLTSFGSILENFNWGMRKIQKKLWTHWSCFPNFYSIKIDDHQTLRRPFNIHIFKGFSKGTWWSNIIQPNYKWQIINHFIISQLIIHSCSWSIHKQSIIHVHDHHGLPYLILKIPPPMRFQNIIT